MSGQTRAIFVWYCAECSDGAGPFDDEDDCDADADLHNNEYHRA